MLQSSADMGRWSSFRVAGCTTCGTCISEQAPSRTRFLTTSMKRCSCILVCPRAAHCVNDKNLSRLIRLELILEASRTGGRGRWRRFITTCIEPNTCQRLLALRLPVRCIPRDASNHVPNPPPPFPPTTSRSDQQVLPRPLQRTRPQILISNRSIHLQRRIMPRHPRNEPRDAHQLRR